MDNNIVYDLEREKRWNMAKDKEPLAIDRICNILQKATGEVCTSKRYDEIWFNKYDPSFSENEWVRGASDYYIKFNNRIIYAEIKIKAIKFHKTVNGGVTRKGSQIAKYGCESFYIDIVPVYKNMCDFVKKTSIDPNSFLIFFIDDEMTDVNAISLREIKALEKNGFNGEKLCVFSEGYGTRTEYGAAPNYLIPEVCTNDLKIDMNQYLYQHSSADFIVDIQKASVDNRRFFGYSNGYYHMDRNCMYIKNKRDNEIKKISLEEAEKLKYIKCKNCFSVNNQQKKPFKN